MNLEDKAKIKQAFLDAAKTPAAQAVLKIGCDGSPITAAKILELAAEGPEIYEQVDKQIAAGTTTLDQYLQLIRTTYQP